MMIDLEDGFEDVIGKTLRGTGMSDGILCYLTGVEVEMIASLKEGNFDEQAVRTVAPSLGLDADCLVELGKKGWHPAEVEVEGLLQFNTDYQGMMTVNSYLVWDPATKEAALFDTGANAEEALSVVKERGLDLKTLFFTHSHVDHIIDANRVWANYPGISSFVNGLEPVEGAQRFAVGEAFMIGGLKVETRLTCGHSPGGTTYVIHGLAKPVAVVGDAIFAQSMGGGAISFRDALATNRAEIFTLEDETILCPGHGPMTTVGEEKAHNPFYPEFK